VELLTAKGLTFNYIDPLYRLLRKEGWDNNNALTRVELLHEKKVPFQEVEPIYTLLRKEGWDNNNSLNRVETIHAKGIPFSYIDPIYALLRKEGWDNNNALIRVELLHAKGVPLSLLEPAYQFLRKEGWSNNNALTQVENISEKGIPQVYLLTMFKYFRTQNHGPDNALKLVIEYFVSTNNRVYPQPVETMTDIPKLYNFFKSSGHNNPVSIDLAELSHAKGLQYNYVRAMHPFFKNDCGFDPLVSLDQVKNFFDISLSSGPIPTFDQLVADVPKFFNFFRNNCGLDTNISLDRLRRMIRGVGKVDFNAFQNMYNGCKGRGMDNNASLDQAFNTVAL
jgi:hypothetical protein